MFEFVWFKKYLNRTLFLYAFKHVEYLLYQCINYFQVSICGSFNHNFLNSCMLELVFNYQHPIASNKHFYPAPVQCYDNFATSLKIGTSSYKYYVGRWNIKSHDEPVSL